MKQKIWISHKKRKIIVKNVSTIMVFLILALTTIHLDMHAAGKRKAEKAPENESHCSKRGVRGTEQEKLDWLLFDAARTGNTNAVEKLLNMNANPKMLINGCTALHIAARNHHFYCIMKLLASKKVTINACADNFMTPLHEAVCISNNEKHIITEEACVAGLIDNWAPNVNAQNSDKNTPLHLAVMYGHEHYVRTLLARNANLALRNTQGKTPLMIAEEKRFGAITDLLKTPAKVEEMDIL